MLIKVVGFGGQSDLRTQQIRYSATLALSRGLIASSSFPLIVLRQLSSICSLKPRRSHGGHHDIHCPRKLSFQILINTHFFPTKVYWVIAVKKKLEIGGVTCCHLISIITHLLLPSRGVRWKSLLQTAPTSRICNDFLTQLLMSEMAQLWPALFLREEATVKETRQFCMVMGAVKRFELSEWHITWEWMDIPLLPGKGESL